MLPLPASRMLPSSSRAFLKILLLSSPTLLPWRERKSPSRNRGQYHTSLFKYLFHALISRLLTANKTKDYSISRFGNFAPHRNLLSFCPTISPRDFFLCDFFIKNCAIFFLRSPHSPLSPSACKGSRLPVLTRTGGKHTLQRLSSGWVTGALGPSTVSDEYE